MGKLVTITPSQTKELLLIIADLYIEKEEELCKYDAVIGDGDHGITMARGAKAAKIQLSEMEDESCRNYFKKYGRTLVSTLGGAMGPLFGSIFLEVSKALKDKEEIDLEAFAIGFENAQLKIMDLGGAKPGDKTMLDSIEPTALSLKESLEANLSLAEGFEKAAVAAKQGVKYTIALRARRGRARYLEDKSIGHQDAGATSFCYLIETIRTFINQ